MRKLLVLPLFLLCSLLSPLLLPAGAPAKEYRLQPGLTLLLPEIAAPWQVSREPGKAFLQHLIEHVREKAAQTGQQLTDAQARKIALQRASSNQLFVSHPQSGAHLLISLAPLKPGEQPPSARAVTLSANYAVESVLEEGWQASHTEQAVTAIKGARSARWIAIDYRHEGKAGRFMGIVGFANPYWFWFYANLHERDREQEQFLEKLMLGIELRVTAPAG